MTLQWASLADWSETSWWCLASCPPGPDPHPPGVERLWSAQTESPVVGVETQDGAPLPPDLRSVCFASPLLCPHSHLLESSQSHWIHSDFLNMVCHMTAASLDTTKEPLQLWQGRLSRGQ